VRGECRQPSGTSVQLPLSAEGWLTMTCGAAAPTGGDGGSGKAEEGDDPR
jgi:hypothetical protein